MSALKIFAIFCLFGLIMSTHKAKVMKHKMTGIFQNTLQGPKPLGFNLAEVKVIQGSAEQPVQNDKFQCPDGYQYASFWDVHNQPTLFQDSMSMNGIDRLQGGGSVGGQQYDIRSKEEDGRRLAGGFCLLVTGYTDVLVMTGTQCPQDYSIPTYNEVENNANGWCQLLEPDATVLIGAAGTFQGTNYNCNAQDYSDTQADNVLCVKRQIGGVQVVHDSNEWRCGTGLSLVSVAEVLADTQGFCNVLNDWDIVRLQGGGSMDGPGYGCHVRNEDTRSLGGYLCAPDTKARLGPSYNING